MARIGRRSKITSVPEQGLRSDLMLKNTSSALRKSCKVRSCLMMMNLLKKLPIQNKKKTSLKSNP